MGKPDLPSVLFFLVCFLVGWLLFYKFLCASVMAMVLVKQLVVLNRRCGEDKVA